MKNLRASKKTGLHVQNFLLVVENQLGFLIRVVLLNGGWDCGIIVFFSKRWEANL